MYVIKYYPVLFLFQLKKYNRTLGSDSRKSQSTYKGKKIMAPSNTHKTTAISIVWSSLVITQVLRTTSIVGSRYVYPMAQSPFDSVTTVVMALVPVQQQQQQQWRKHVVTPLYDKKRTTAASSKGGNGGFGNIVKDMMSTTFPYTGALRPGKQSPQRIVLDETIVKPDYWQTGTPSKDKSKNVLLPWMIEVKSSDEIDKMRRAGRLARQVLDLAGRAVRPGITTDEIDSIVYDEIIKVNIGWGFCVFFWFSKIMHRLILCFYTF
jgi:Metallopeptidase family M24